MGFADTVADVDKIHVSVDLHDMYRPVVLEGPHAGDVHGVIAAQDDRQGAVVQYLTNREFGVGVTGGGIGVDDVGMADIDAPFFFARKLSAALLMVAGTSIIQRKKRSGLSDDAR